MLTLQLMLTIITEYVEKLFLVNIEDDSTAFLMVVCVCILLSDYSYQRVRQLVGPYYNKTMYMPVLGQ